MPVRFRDRREAGQRLARELVSLAGRPDVVVLGLPRGGVPVAHEVAAALGAPLDVFTVRKLGAPGHEELAMGAVASGGFRVVNPHVVQALRISREAFDRVTADEEREVARRDRAFRDGQPFPNLTGATVVVVDDGIATGSTMLVAVRALRQQAPAAIVVAAPVMAREAHAALAREADACVSVATPEPFYGVGLWYGDFRQTTDEEVRALLAGSGREPVGIGR